MKRIKLTVAYDGTDFHGWQIQPGVRTVEGELNKALSELTKEEIAVIGASRTDAGVHANGNVAVFDTESTIPPDRFMQALNTYLPQDVKIVSSCEVAGDFHPRKCDCVKTYEYRIHNSQIPDPLRVRYTWDYPRPLDEKRMREAAQYLVGIHDFAGYASVHTQAETTVRTVYSIEVQRDGEEISVLVKGSGFLYNMVRIIAGTLTEVGCGNHEPEWVKLALDECDRTLGGPTAPPQGLTLKEIKYAD